MDSARLDRGGVPGNLVAGEARVVDWELGMSKMHEYGGDVTVTLKKRLTEGAAVGEEEYRSWLIDQISEDLFYFFNEGDIKDIQVDDVRKVE